MVKKMTRDYGLGTLLKRYGLSAYFTVFLFLPPQINAVLIWLIFLLFITVSKRARVEVLHPSRLVQIIFLFLIATILSAVMIGNPGRGIREIVIWTYVLGMGWCFSAIRKFKNVLWGFLMADIILALLWIFTSGEYMEWMRYVPDNNNASLLLLCGIIVKRYLDGSYSGRAYFISGIEMLYAFAIILIYSRGIIALTILYYLFVFFYFEYKSKRVFILLGLASYSFLMEGCLFGELKAVVFLQGLYEQIVYINPSNLLRIELYRQVLFERIPENIFTGIGVGNFERIFIFDVGLWHTHNIYFQVLLEYGVLGGVLLFFLINYLYSFLVKELGRYDKNASNMALSVMGAFLLFGCVEYVWFRPNIMAFFFAFFVMLERYCRNKRRMRYGI